jgi:hypothetical protein
LEAVAIARGEAYFRPRAEQGRNFSGLRYGIKTPTDVDCFLDYGNEAFVFVEAKFHTSSTMQRGQELAFERVCDACERGGVPSLYVVAIHTHPIQDQIDFAKCTVTKFRYQGQWYPAKQTMTVKAIADRFISKHGKKTSAA